MKINQKLFFLPSLFCLAFLLPTVGMAAEIETYVVKPISQQKILPDTPPNLFPFAGAANQSGLEVKACRGEFEPASFVLRSNEKVSDIRLQVSDLYSSGQTMIPKSAIDIRLVKCWFQAGTTIFKEKKILVPELLLKDNDLVRVDRANRKNYLRTKVGNYDRVIELTSAGDIFPADSGIHDADELQPFDLKPDFNQQLWVTVHVPQSAAPHTYHGTIYLSSGNERLGTMRITVEVLPFPLEPPSLEYALYYRGQLTREGVKGINSDEKTVQQYNLELRNMRDHGVLYPVLYQSYGEMLGPALTLRSDAGLPKDKLYAIRIGTGKLSYFDASNPEKLRSDILEWRTFIARYGFQELYIYGEDEAKGNDLLAQRSAWTLSREAGAKVYASGYKGAADVIGHYIDLQILSGEFKPEEVDKWHRLGKKVFIYGNPQVGVEDAETYRRNYGLALLRHGYDGVMNYAYQHGFGHIWNDFDHVTSKKEYRDHVFAYPTSNGVVDTIQWEGFREAVDDVRYLTTLAKSIGQNDVRQLCATLPESDLDEVRSIIIGRINRSLGHDPGQTASCTNPKNLRIK